MSAHTPGPWVVVFSERNGAALRIDAPHDMHTPGGAGSPVRQNGISMPACDIGKANARLIAAAPDLLAALSWLLGMVEQPSMARDPDDYLDQMALACGAARVAIAKAEGSAS